VQAVAGRGVLPDGDEQEPWFLCYQHDEKVVIETLTVFEEAVKEAKKNLKKG